MKIEYKPLSYRSPKSSNTFSIFHLCAQEPDALESMTVGEMGCLSSDKEQWGWGGRYRSQRHENTALQPVQSAAVVPYLSRCRSEVTASGNSRGKQEVKH